MRLSGLLFALMSSVFLISTFAFAAETAPVDIDFKYQSVFSQNPEINHEALARLLSYYDQNLSKIQNKTYVMFVDFSIDNDVPRFYLIDMRDGSRELYLVAHGRGSDPQATGKARIFSNTPNSLMSSLGIFKTDTKPFNGENGISLHMIGLEKTNSQAYIRGILIHGAAYVSPNLHPLGRSEGCFAVEQSLVRNLIDKVEDGALLMSWIDPRLIENR